MNQMIYRPANLSDLPRLWDMASKAIEYFRLQGIRQWQKGEPNPDTIREAVSKGEVRVLSQGDQAVAMISVVPGPEINYQSIEGAWLNDAPYYAFHRVCVDFDRKGQGLAGLLFSRSQEYVQSLGCTNIRIDTHPDNRSMQRALAKSGFQYCGRLILRQGSEAGDPRLAYQKILD